MYRYQGNTGRYVWVPDSPSQVSAAQSRRSPEPFPAPEHSGQRRHGRQPPESARPSLADLGGGLSDMLSRVFPDGFEMEDALLLLVLFLMYKETGDKDLLIIMGAMFLL